MIPPMLPETPPPETTLEVLLARAMLDALWDATNALLYAQLLLEEDAWLEALPRLCYAANDLEGL